MTRTRFLIGVALLAVLTGGGVAFAQTIIEPEPEPSDDDYTQGEPEPIILADRVCGNLPAARCSEGACPNAPDGRPQVCGRTAGGCGCAPINPPSPPPPKPQCSDALDNDADTKIDYPADPGCVGPNDNDERDQALIGPASTTLIKPLLPGGAVLPGLQGLQGAATTAQFRAPGGALPNWLQRMINLFRWFFLLKPGGAIVPGLR